MNYLDELNDIQRQAVEHISGPSLIIAGPGSGKTRVLTYRIAHLLNCGVAPWSVLALTFTNKAAKEMKARIQAVAQEGVDKIWAGTFHSIFARILRAEASKIGFPSDFSIYDSQDAKSALSEIVKSNGLDTKIYNTGALYNKISLAKNNLISPEMYFQDANRILVDKQQKMPYVYKIYDLYMKKCQRSAAMDFDDLLYQMHFLLLKNEDNVLEKYRNKFRHVLVDEFQDTNLLQYSIIKKLVDYPGSERNISVVGDDAQSIYAFRGASIQNILNFEKDFSDLQVFKLEQNYRSTNYIIQAANDIISRNDKQIKKTIFTENTGGDPIKVVHAMTDSEEARQVVSAIVEQKNRNHLENDEIAILYRTNAQSRIFEEALKSRRIPYKIYGGTSFYDRKEVKDVLAYLRVVVNSKDEEALKRILNYPTRGIGAKSIQKILQISEHENLSLWTILSNIQHAELPKRTEGAIQQFVQMILLFQDKLKNSNAYELARYVVKMTGIVELISKEKTLEAQGRLENINELLDGIKSFVEEDSMDAFNTNIEDKSLMSYLQNVILLTDLDNEEEDARQVKLMSVHASKGLEFRSVFIVGLEEELFPSMMAIKANNSRAAIDEERRLFYVAITRAKEFLQLSYASSRYRFGNMLYCSSSRFIEEISPKYLDMNSKVASSTVSRPRARVQQIRKPQQIKKVVELPEDFKPSPISALFEGARILHPRFGKGKIVSIDGNISNKIATISFGADIGDKRIMLKFAKIQLLE